jgi:endonuclease/exonuclease/phosphatase (EEP) superfamily protein YafD
MLVQNIRALALWKSEHMRVVSLNAAHTARPRPLPVTLVDRIGQLKPDLLILNEFVDVRFSLGTRDALSSIGLDNFAVTEVDEYHPTWWNNQVLVACNHPIQSAASPLGGPGTISRTNTLCFSTMGLDITALRVPMQTSKAGWYGYWEWLKTAIQGDIVIGDFNADLRRARRQDLVLQDLIDHGGWKIRTDGDLGDSYFGKNGTKSRVDHLLTRGSVGIQAIEYVAAGIAPPHSDHAALVVDVELIDDS